MIPSRSMPRAAKVLSLAAVLASLVVVVWSAVACAPMSACRWEPRAPTPTPTPMPAPPCSSSEALPDGRCPAPSWDAYVTTRPWARDLDPAVAHPGWPGRPSACGAGKCG